jgi:hypothetical protein
VAADKSLLHCLRRYDSLRRAVPSPLYGSRQWWIETERRKEEGCQARLIALCDFAFHALCPGSCPDRSSKYASPRLASSEALESSQSRTRAAEERTRVIWDNGFASCSNPALTLDSAQPVHPTSTSHRPARVYPSSPRHWSGQTDSCSLAFSAFP